MSTRPILACIGAFISTVYITANVAIASPVTPDTPEETADNNTLTLILNDDPESSDIDNRSGINAGACIGEFSLPKVDALGIINYGLHVKCGGSGFLPLSAEIHLEEEHLGLSYQEVDSANKQLTEGGYGFVHGEVVCNPDSAGHDYRITGMVSAGDHRKPGISEEVHLPCDV